MKRLEFLGAALVLLATPALPAAPSPAPTSQLSLDRAYTLGRPRALPRLAGPHWRFQTRRYPEFDALEWQVRLRADPGVPTPLFDDLQSADFTVGFPHLAAVTVHWSKGSRSSAADFQPAAEELQPGKSFTLESFGGRSSDGALPYFNLATAGGGLIVAVGWTGGWRASFELAQPGQVRVRAGLRDARFKLLAGEEVRLPSILAMGYRGDWLEGQNRFRRLMLRHFTPTNHPPLELMPVAASVHGMIGFNDTTETNLVALCADLAATRLPLDTFWLDAGWNQGGFAGGQGNPDPDPARFPRGLGPVGEAARRHGQRFLAWFEPERVMRGTRLDREHPEWLRLPTGTPPELRYQETDGFRLLDLGFPAARAWTLDYLSGCVTSAGIGVYRQDFNLYPAFFWHTGEPPERRGIAEVGHIAGLYDLLDGLAARHPGLVIDNCASGGRRLDFEMMRRSVALWRSDSCWDDKLYPRNAQAMTHGLSLWLPLHGLGAAAADPVALRSGMGACSAFAIDFRAPAAVQALRTHLDRFLRTRRLYAADFHPLTPWSIDPRQWLAFQFHDPIRGEGIVQAFCGDTAARLELRVRLRGLVPGRRYALSNWDAPESRPVLKGAALAEPGLLLRATRTNDAIVVEYQPAK